MNFPSEAEAQKEADRLNGQMEADQGCPLTKERCITVCVCFEKAYVKGMPRRPQPCPSEDTTWTVRGFCCTNYMFTGIEGGPKA